MYSTKSIARLTGWLIMSREHGHSSIYWTCLILSLSVAARSSEIPLSRVCLLHFMRRTVLILCGKTATWGIFKLKRPKTHIPLNIFMQVCYSYYWHGLWECRTWASGRNAYRKGRKEDLVWLSRSFMLEYNDITHMDTNNLIQTPTQTFEQDTYTGHAHYYIESGVQNL